MFCGQTWRQFWALMRKNALIKLRLWPTTLAEIFLPILIMAAIAGIRSQISRTDVPDTHYVGPNSAFSNTQPYATNDQTGSLNYSNAMINFYQQTLVKYNTKLAFAPSPGAGQALGNYLVSEYPFLGNHVIYFGTEGDIINAVKDPLYKKDALHPGISAGIILTKIADPSSGQYEWRYTLRMNVTGEQAAVPNTFQVKATDDITLTYKREYWQQYLYQGFMALQSNIETWMLNQVGYNGSTIVTSQPFPSIKHVDDSFADVIKGFLGLLFTLIYMWPVTRVTKVIVEEKELRIKEAMKIMGLSDFVLWFSWFCTYAVVFAISSLGIIIVNGRNVYQYSDKGIIFFYFWLFGMGSFAFCYLVQAFFSRATVASTVAAILFLGSFFPYYAVFDDTSSSGQKTLACLSVPLCFSLGASTAASLESANQGVTNASIRTKIDNFSFDTTIGMLIFDIIWYLLLGVYLDHVLPSAYGVPLPWNFCCTPKWWKASCRSKRKIAPGSQRSLEMSGMSAVPLPGTSAEKPGADPNIEPVGPELEARTGITVSHLRREFKSEREDGAPIVAVDDVSLSMYEGQIFALLGHNGAGKTTIISMLTGMIPATSGDAQIYGQNISTDMASIRDSVGICPQHNILFDLLTVSEHLYLFGRIKGVPAEQLEHEVNTFIRDVGLTEKKDSKAGVLSGGQKRKLSVAIALIGGSRVVFLDEPTSGMDPYSRRSTWEILRHAKEGRVIILTTHFMDEADQLGDRIAIMAHGDVKCCGSSLFLKSRFGVGYTLTVSKSGDSQALHEAIHKAVPAAEVLTDVAGEIAFRLPFDASPAFPALFKNMDENQEKFGILSYGISVTTLEEVFLRVGRDESADQKTRLDDVATFRRQSSANRLAHKHDHDHDHDHSHDEKEEKNGAAKGKTGTVYDFNNVNLKNLSTDPIRHVYALLVKRIQIARRDRKVFMWQLIYPFLIMIIGVGLLKLGLSFSFPSVKIDTSPYNTPHRVMWPNFPEVATDAPLSSVFANNVGYGNSISVNYPWDSPVNLFNQTERNLRALNFSKNLLNDWKTYRFKESRYVALCWEGFEGPQPWNDYTNRTYLRLFHNTTASASLPVGLNLYHNMIYQQYTGRAPSAKISVLLDPLPRTTDQEALQSSITAVLIAIGLAFIPASFIGQVVREREYKAKHQQFLSGVDVTAYWGSNYVWDFSNYLVTAFVALIVVAIYDIKQLIGENAGATVLTLILFGFACPTFTYAFSFFFSNHTSAQNISLLVFIFSGPMLLIASVILDIIASTRDVNKVLKFFYRILPHYSVGESLAALIVRKASIATGGVVKGQWDMDVTGWPLLYMAIEAVVFFLIVLVIEKVLRTPQWLAKVYPDPSIPPAPFEEDPDIIAERNRVQNNATLDVGTANTPSTRDIIQLRGLRKVYRSRLATPPKVAVHNVWFGIAPGECFGFLGINGAGKTTSMQMLTGDVIPTDGTAVLDGLDVLTQQRAIRRLIGYCPQFDALFDSMTAREHLTFYSRIKGIPENIIPEYVEAMIQQLDLVEYADQPSKGYSGGNKRKLSVGVALIGNPPIVFLDEPSTGMDPKSRRFMWDLISSTMAGRSVMLTTHSMEECEALCSRIGIMVSGRLRCVGTAQHLKHRYGDGYQVDVSCGTNSTDAVARFVSDMLPGAVVIERHPNTAKFRVPKVDPQGRRNTLADLFTLMEHNRKQINVIEYSVSETTLEQIFIHFAKQQEEETGEVAGLTDVAAYSPVGSRPPVEIRQ